MDTHKGDRYSDYSVPRHERNYDNNYSSSFSGDGHRHHHHHNNSNGEQTDSTGCDGDGDFASRQFSLSGRKRHFSPDHVDGGGYVKLYVGAIPRTAREENIRSLFGEYGNIIEVVLLKDKRTGQQKECCFVKYATVEEADRAIGELHNQYVCPGGVVPIKVRYAEGEQERLGASGTHACKLYVGCLNKQASKSEIEEIFSAYGLVKDVYIVRDELKQNRGCGFVQFPHRDMAVAAISALNGTYIMRGCDQPLIVRFADPKKPRSGELRGNNRVGGPGFCPTIQESARPATYLSDPITGHKLPNVSQPPSPKSLTSSSQDCPIQATAGTDSILGNGFPSSVQQDCPIQATTDHASDSLMGNGFPSSVQQQNKQQKVGELDNNTPTPAKRMRSVKSQVKSSQSSSEGNKGNMELVMAEEFVEKECITKDTDLPVIIECKGLRSSQARTSHHFPSEESLELFRDQNQQLNDSTGHKIKEINQLEEGGESIPKKRRGRPPKLLAKSREALVAGKDHNGDVVVTDETVVKDCITSEVELAAITGVQSARIKGSNLKLEINQLEEAGESNPKKRRGRPPKLLAKSPEALVADTQDASRGEKTAEDFGTYFITEGVEMAIDKSPSSMSDDQPLSTWFEGMHSPTVDGPRVSTARTVQHTEESKRHREIGMESPAVDANVDIVPDESQSLPFVKTFPLWETIETMEVFRVMPQKPHFRPLDSCKERDREGLAVGSMVTFSNVATKTLALHFDDPRSVIEDGLETLLDLESHGFDVKLVRDRLTRLLLIKDQQEQLHDQTTELKTQIMEHTCQKSKLDEEIDEIGKLIMELQEKRALVLPLKETKDSEIASLQSRVKDIIEDNKSVKVDFEGLAAAPW